MLKQFLVYIKVVTLSAFVILMLVTFQPIAESALGDLNLLDDQMEVHEHFEEIVNAPDSTLAAGLLPINPVDQSGLNQAGDLSEFTSYLPQTSEGETAPQSSSSSEITFFPPTNSSPPPEAAALIQSSPSRTTTNTLMKGMVCTSAISDCNRSVDDVRASFMAIVTDNGPDHGGFVFGLDGAPDPNNFFHWQSINRLNHQGGNFVVLTESQKNTGGTLVVAEMAAVTSGVDGKWDDEARTPPSDFNPNNTIIAVKDVGEIDGEPFLNHPGGAQVMGDFVVYGNACHSNDACSGTPARVEIWNLADPFNPSFVSYFTVPKDGPLHGGSTLAASTKLQDGSYLLMIGSHKPAVLQFFTSSSMGGSWNEIGSWAKENHNIPWPSDFEFQSIQFLTDAGSGDLYLVGTVGHMPVVPTDDEDLAYLYKLSMPGEEIRLDHVARRKMYCADGILSTKYCNFNAGAGIFVTQDGKLALYAVEHDNDGPEGSIKMEQFWDTCPDGQPPPVGFEGRCKGDFVPGPVEFIEPSADVPLPIGETVNVKVRVSPPEGEVINTVELITNPADGDPGGFMAQNGDYWERSWTPNPPSGIERQGYTLLVSARSSSGLEIARGDLYVVAEGANLVEPRIIAPSAVFQGAQVDVEINAPDADIVRLSVDGINVRLSRSDDSWYFSWTPTIGNHDLLATIVYPGGALRSLSHTLQVLEPKDMEIININEYAILGKVKDLRMEAPFHFRSSYPTEIPVSDYECGIVGYSSRGGDLGEHISYLFDEWDTVTPAPDLMGIYLFPGAKTWHLVPDINTFHHEWFMWPVLRGDYVDRPETWDVDILCVHKSVASIKPFRNLGDNIYYNTSIPFDQQVCAIGGFWAKRGDINEKGTRDIFQMYLYRNQRNWHIRADFATHQGDKGGHENWSVNLLCIDERVAALDGPAPGKPFFLEEFKVLGDNVGIERQFSTGISSDDYVCGVAGFAAYDGDIDEHDKSANSNLFSAYLYPQNGTWHVRADFRTHKNDESWDIQVICAQKEGRPSPSWNTSHEELKDDDCLDFTGLGRISGKCQVLYNEAINITGPVTLFGGGYEGDSLLVQNQCAVDDAVGVFINDRDPSTGKPRWSVPDICLRAGESMTIEQGNTYDFRGASVSAGTTLPFNLKSRLSAPTLTRAYPKLFPVPYGPGIALEWEPTLHPQATFFEIQFSEDGGSTWKVYSRNRDISYGGWMNHHSNFKCGFGFERCLNRRQEYSYRVRVLDSAQNPVTDWSNTLTTTSFDWPAHVNLAQPFPPGPYPFKEEVTLQVEDTYGQGMRLEWTLIPYSGASYTVLSGCQSGSYTNPNVNTCRIEIRNELFAFQLTGSSKMAKLAPVTSVDVRIQGTDSFGYSASDGLSLIFEQSCPVGSCGPVDKEIPDSRDELEQPK